MKIELIYDAQCPNVEAARQALREALRIAGLPGGWQEWDRNDPESPDRVRGYGSPTVLIDGQDITGAAPTGANACRVYAQGDGGFAGTPPVTTLVAALGSAGNTNGSKSWQGSVTALAAAGAALLPAATCWPAYAALLSSAGLSFIDYTPYLPWVLGALLAAALIALGLQAKRRRTWGAFWLTLAGAIGAIAGKFAFESNYLVYLGVGLLMAASMWNLWHRAGTANQNCPACPPTPK
jgi:hypothetical protein